MRRKNRSQPQVATEPRHRQLRQGDVLIEVVASVPKGATQVHDRVLAHGEVTGHVHAIATENFQRFSHGDNDYFSTAVADQVTHDEHGPLPTEAGLTYEVTRQRQYDPLTSIPVPVAD